MSLSMFVAGTPVAQGSKRGIPIYRRTADGREWTGRVVLAESAGQRLAEWRAAIVHAARDAHPGRILDGPVALGLVFRLPRPQRPRYGLPATRPDWDKLARAVCDALRAGGLIRDDAQIVYATVSKRYALPGEEVGVLIELAEVR